MIDKMIQRNRWSIWKVLAHPTHGLVRKELYTLGLELVTVNGCTCINGMLLFPRPEFEDYANDPSHVVWRRRLLSRQFTPLLSEAASSGRNRSPCLSS
jgi:hypothetical protein